MYARAHKISQLMFETFHQSTVILIKSSMVVLHKIRLVAVVISVIIILTHTHGLICTSH